MEDDKSILIGHKYMSKTFTSTNSYDYEYEYYEYNETGEIILAFFNRLGFNFINNQPPCGCCTYWIEKISDTERVHCSSDSTIDTRFEESSPAGKYSLFLFPCNSHKDILLYR